MFNFFIFLFNCVSLIEVLVGMGKIYIIKNFYFCLLLGISYDGELLELLIVE